MDTQTPIKSVLETILLWSRSKPDWQRDALRRIIANGRPDDLSFDQILNLCKKERGAEGVELEAIPLATEHLPTIPGDSAAIRLHAISAIRGVNQLAGDQEITFEPDGITVIYGQNGAGKSGYARILKRACRARYPGEIMPDAFNPPPAGKATASISISRAGVLQEPHSWKDTGTPDPAVSAICVFDQDCASVHIREKNEVIFRPFGLDIPDELAGVCQRVKERLVAEQKQLEEARHPVFLKPTWDASTSVGKTMGGLTGDTDLSRLETSGCVTPAEEARHKRLSEDLAKDPIAAAAQQRLFAGSVKQIRGVLRALATTYSDEVLSGLKAFADNARSAREVAALAAGEAFGGLPIPGVGADAWRALWEAARHYSEQVAYPKQAFPPEGDKICVLCQQPLTASVQTRMAGFEVFIRGNLEARAREAEKSYETARKSFLSKSINVGLIAQTRRRIAIDDAKLARHILRFAASARLRRAKCIKALADKSVMSLSPFADNPINDLVAFEASLLAYANELDAAADIEGRRSLLAERIELRDRLAVPELLPVARAEINRLKTLRVLTRCIADTVTNTVTKLGNQLADEVITPKMRDQFQSEIVRLAADRVRVEVVRSGGKFGSPQYEVRFFANATAKVYNVLSEGEQTCVALAAFLTELATASNESALVFDDPVSSLDHLWRKKVAERLVAETARRQIIVFTHDLVFVNDLHDLAQAAGAKVKMVTLARGAAGAGVVSLGLPWRASRVPERIDTMEKAARAARELHIRNDDDGYRRDVVNIYALLRATWERALEDNALAGVIHRHRDYIDTKHLKKVTILDATDCATFDNGFKKCCDLIEAHDPSRGRDAGMPPPDEILQDIKDLLDWTVSIRDRQKTIT